METKNIITEQEIKDLALMLLYINSWKVVEHRGKKNKPTTYYSFNEGFATTNRDILEILEKEGFISIGESLRSPITLYAEGQQKARELLQKNYGKDFEVTRIGGY
jgi:hypothetical protein